MSEQEMPAQIWAYPHDEQSTRGRWHNVPVQHADAAEYRRADVPLTDAECLRNEKVQRMQAENERLRLLLARNLVMDFGSGEEGADELGGIGAVIAMVKDYHAALEQEEG